MRITGFALFALLGLMFWSGQASAAQSNRIIHSGDYDMFRVGPRQGWRACERTCNGDPRCRAWTFIRSRKQCRLKYIAGESVRNNCCVSGVKGHHGGDQASQQRFCSNYAKQAVQAHEANLSQRCRFRGRRWRGDFSPHYQYCLRVQRSEANAETRERKERIEHCRSHAANSQQKRCDHYARLAVAQANTNAKANCGFRGRNWNTRRRVHVHHCRDTSWEDARDLTLRRERKLRNCLSIR